MSPALPHSAAFHADDLQRLLSSVAAKAKVSGLFGEVTVEGGCLSCAAAASAEPAFYRLQPENGRLWVSLVTANRWLSQSIEADLVHTGDKLDHLLGDELVDQEYAGPPLTIEHFRSEDKLFTFRTVLPIDPKACATPAAVETSLKVLKAYQACFAPLGDMSAGEDEE